MADMRVPPHLFQRGGVWYVERVIRGIRFKESTRVPVGGEKDLRLAIAKQREIELQWEQQASGVKEVPTFGEWWEDTYKPTYSAQKARPEMDDTMVSYALEKWKRYRLDRITKSMCERHLHERLKSVSQGTVTRERGLLQAMFQRAIEDDLLRKNPFENVERIRDEIRTRVLTRDEQRKLHDVLSAQFQRWLVFMIGTGLRLEESRAVKVAHLDRKARLLEVQADAAKGGKGRHVPIYDEVEEAVDAQQQEFGRLWHANPQNYRDMLQRGAKDAKIDHLSPHTLRHTFATRYLQAGGDIFILSKIMGHSSVTMTERQYVHLLKTDLVKPSKGLDLGLSASAHVVPFEKKAQ